MPSFSLISNSVNVDEHHFVEGLAPHKSSIYAFADSTQKHDSYLADLSKILLVELVGNRQPPFNLLLKVLLD